MTITISTMRDASTAAAVKAGTPGYHYVGRAMPRQGLAGSPLGNYWKPGRDGTIAEVLAKFETGFRIAVSSPVPLLKDADKVAALAGIVADLNNGRHVVLACWCCHGSAEEAAGKCHAAVIAKVAMGRMTK